MTPDNSQQNCAEESLDLAAIIKEAMTKDKRIEKLEQANAELKEQLQDKEHPTFTRTIAGFHADLVIALNDVRMLEIANAELKDKLTFFGSIMDAQKEENAELKKLSESLELEVQDYDRLVGEVAKERDELKAELKFAQAARETHFDMNKILKKDVAELIAEKDLLFKENAKLRAALEKLHDQIDAEWIKVYIREALKPGGES